MPTQKITELHIRDILKKKAMGLPNRQIAKILDLSEPTIAKIYRRYSDWKCPKCGHISSPNLLTCKKCGLQKDEQKKH